MSVRAVIRPMSMDDLEAVLENERLVFQEPWSRKSYEFEIKENRFSIAVVLEVEERIIGHAVVWHVLSEFHIATISILPEYQNRGWGKFLLQALLEMAEGAEYALLEVRRGNKHAIRLYQRFGFIPLRIRHNYYRDGEDAIVMRKRLS